jgi:RNA polymerase sigma factor (sigma-70 family)
MITKYINEHYTEILNKFKAITKNHQDTQDLLQDCILNFLEKGNDYTNQVLQDNKVQNYLVRMAHIQFNSSTSPFYSQYKKSSLKSREINEEFVQIEDKVIMHEDTEKLVDKIKIYIGNLPVYERTLAERHLIDNKSQREMSKMYNINRLHIAKDVDNIKKNIRITFNRNDFKTK